MSQRYSSPHGTTRGYDDLRRAHALTTVEIIHPT